MAIDVNVKVELHEGKIVPVDCDEPMYGFMDLYEYINSENMRHLMEEKMDITLDEKTKEENSKED